MTLSTAAGMATAMLLLALTPGPGMMATVSRALLSGFKDALFVVLGIVTGDLIFLLFAIFGLSALASALGTLFVLVKYLGGLYLLWLGYSLWRQHPAAAIQHTSSATTARAAYLSGLFITLGNPKVILFYLGFLPAFIDLESLQRTDILLVMLIVSGVIGLSMLLYAYMAARSRRLISPEGGGSILQRISGTVMMATGGIILTRS